MLRHLFYKLWSSGSSMSILKRTFSEQRVSKEVPHKFYAAIPGSLLHSRYTIIRQLGAGRHSNVWLASDFQ